MGTWGTGTFENDDASDWLYDLEASSDLSVIEAALNAAELDYIEAPDGCTILAAAEIILALSGHVRTDLPDTAALWVRNNQPLSLCVAELRPAAIAAVAAVLSENSELKALWQATEARADWMSNIHTIRSALVRSAEKPDTQPATSLREDQDLDFR